jgi:2-(1,2-epoxy-1,2-dihydrophenyl)acetyl-CoA isomerase
VSVAHDPNSLVLLQQQDGVATLTLNDPARLNALSGAMVQAALTALHGLQDDPSLRVLVLRGAGRAFCAGADLAELSDAQAAPAQIETLMRDGGNPLVLALRALPVPVLTVLHGMAAGGGVGLVLAADVVIAGRSGAFMLPFVPALGLVPDMGASWVMQRALGEARTAALSLLGDRLDAERAAQWGLIWSCVDDERLDAEAAALAARLAALPPHGVREVRQLLREGAQRDLASQLEQERQRQVALSAGPWFAEGVQAFLQKRRPNFHAQPKEAS